MKCSLDNVIFTETNATTCASTATQRKATSRRYEVSGHHCRAADEKRNGQLGIVQAEKHRCEQLGKLTPLWKNQSSTEVFITTITVGHLLSPEVFRADPIVVDPQRLATAAHAMIRCPIPENELTDDQGYNLSLKESLKHRQSCATERRKFSFHPGRIRQSPIMLAAEALVFADDSMHGAANVATLWRPLRVPERHGGCERKPTRTPFSRCYK